MAEVGASVAAKLAEYLVDPTLQQLQYLFCVGKITRNVDITKAELILKQGRVQERVQEAINRTDRIDAEVNKWKNDVKSLIAEVETLEEQLRANNGCLRGWCPTWRRFSLCGKLAKKSQRMIDLYAKSDFNPFSHSVIAPDVESRTSQNFKFFNSTQMAFDQLWEALQDDGISMIGLWGMGGSGKTTLAREVKKKAEESKLFDRLVLTTISQNPNIENIQDVIAYTLGLKLEKESNEVRAKKLALRLQSEERILIILDDVWAKLNLADIGIPFGGNQQRSCKIVLTTRRLEACNLMECQKTVQLDLLKEDEAWTLFQTHANVADTAKEDLARAIAMECKGLPIAIVAVGTCLKGKGIDQMKVMLYKLRNAKPINVDKGVRDSFACLELSYDYLATPEAKQLLLVCAMFPEDHSISVEDLFRYGVGLGLCCDVDSFETARSQVRTTIYDLIDSSLLMRSIKFKTSAQEYVAMHDVARDFALWRASQEDRTIKVNCTKELNELIANEGLKDCYAVSSWYDNNESPQFPSQLNAPKLEFLLLSSNKPLDMSQASFEGTKGLKALIIDNKYWLRIELQPQSIKHLSNLQTLRLQNWDLRDISFVVSLTRLEILDLQRSKFERVPNGIEKLNKLKLLDLSSCPIDKCCYKVIGRCSQLEELYVPAHFPHSENANCYEYLMGPTALVRLRRYKLEIGGSGRGFEFRNEAGTRALNLGKLNISKLGASIKNLARKATLIEFYELEGGYKSFMPNIVQALGGMNDLTKLRLQRCSKIECIINETSPHEDAVVPILDELELSDMDNLKQLHCGSSPSSLFQKLERLSIFNCPQLLDIGNLGNLKSLQISNCSMLRFLFPVPIACTLCSLEELKIESCSGLKHLFREKCDKEKPVHDQDLTQIELSLLKCLKISGCPMLTSLFPVSIACTFHSLEELEIESCSGLKHLFGEKGGEEQPIHGQDLTQIELPLLKCLKISDCPMLTSLFPVSIACTFRSLEELEIESCSGLKHLFGEKGGEEQPMHDQDLTQIELPLLKCLKLKNLPNLVRICSRSYHPKCPSIETIQWRDCLNMDLQELMCHPLRNEECKPLEAIETIELDNCGVESIFHHQIGVEEQITTFQYLKYLTLRNCARLRFVFSAQICQNLPELTSVTISCCEELEAIFSGNEETDQKNLSIDKSCLLKLKSLEISQCNKLKFILSFRITAATSMLPQLSNLDISDSCQMEEIFKCSNVEDHDIASEREILFPNMEDVRLNELPKLVNVCQGFKLRTVQFCRVEVHDCPKLMPIKRATYAKRTKEGLLREYGLKYSQLYNNEALDLPLSILNVGQLDAQSARVEHKWRVIGDDEEEETNGTEMLRSEQQMVGGVVPTQVLSFQYLHSLEVTHCKKLKHLFSMRTIVENSLPNLTSLTISDCEELEVIFGDVSEDDANYGETIVRSSLKRIGLINLPNLKSVCDQRLQIQVELRDISICNCPKFVDSSMGRALQQLGTISLPQGYSSNVGTSSNVNEEKGKMLISRAEYLLLEDSMNLISLWEGPTFIIFQNLTYLEVSECRELKCIFSSTVIRSLPCLLYLWIEECEELEEMMSSSSSEEHHFPNESSNNSLCFPQLHYLEVNRCRKLKWLFPSLPSSQLHLPGLQILTIKECSQLKGLCNREVEIHEEGFFNNILPRLRYLTVEDCPSFSETTLDALERRNLENNF